MSQHSSPKLPETPNPKQTSKPNPILPKPNYPPLSDPGKRTEFGDKKSGGPGTSNTGAKK